MLITVIALAVAVVVLGVFIYRLYSKLQECRDFTTSYCVGTGNCTQYRHEIYTRLNKLEANSHPNEAELLHNVNTDLGNLETAFRELEFEKIQEIVRCLNDCDLPNRVKTIEERLDNHDKVHEMPEKLKKTFDSAETEQIVAAKSQSPIVPSSATITATINDIFDKVVLPKKVIQHVKSYRRRGKDGKKHTVNGYGRSVRYGKK